MGRIEIYAAFAQFAGVTFVQLKVLSVRAIRKVCLQLSVTIAPRVIESL